MPTAALTVKASAGDHQEITAGSWSNAADRPSDPPTPSAMPITPPIVVSSTASSRNCSVMSRVRAPTALRRPISRVRSRTLTSMMLLTPTPPTSRLIAAMAASTVVSNPRIRPTVPRIWSWVTALNSSPG